MAEMLFRACWKEGWYNPFLTLVLAACAGGLESGKGGREGRTFARSEKSRTHGRLQGRSKPDVRTALVFSMLRRSRRLWCCGTLLTSTELLVR